MRHVERGSYADIRARIESLAVSMAHAHLTENPHDGRRAYTVAFDFVPEIENQVRHALGGLPGEPTQRVFQPRVG